ncbi:MAG: CaiB/BaiF CoA transferase family protein [Gammaproteobacteria bacterium]
MILDGIRVLDFTQYLAGPSATRLMAEMGAEIIKIEPGPRGDPGRAIPMVRDGRSGFFVQQNRGKKSLCLDLNSSRSHELVKKIAAEVDVIIENFGPGVMDKRGLTYDAFAAINPSVIMASISAFGRQSPLAHLNGYDWIAQAFSGLMYTTGPTDGTPHPVGIGICDANAGVHGFAAIGYALVHKLRTGEGQYLDLSMVDAIYHMHEYNVHGRSVAGPDYKAVRMGAHHNLIAPFGIFKGPQGYLVIGVLELQWPRFCEAMGRTDLKEDPRFASNAERSKHRDQLIDIVEAWARGFPTDQKLLEHLESHRVPSAPVMDPIDTLDHPYYRERGMVREVFDRVLGKVEVPGLPFKFSAQPEVLEAEAPLLGEHNQEILAEFTGLSTDEIETLVAEQVLFSEPEPPIASAQ